MMAGKTVSERLATAQAQKHLLDTRIRELEVKVADAERRADTHRKIVLGAILLRRATEDQGRAREEVRDAVRAMSARDRAAFAELGFDWLAGVTGVGNGG